MKNPLRKLKTSFQNIQWNSRRKRFIGLEILIFISFMAVYEIISVIFLEDYTTVKYVLEPVPYLIYTICMLFNMVIFVSGFFFGGMYFQLWLTERTARILMEKMKNNPSAVFNEILNGKKPDKTKSVIP